MRQGNHKANILLLDDEATEIENWREWFRFCDWTPNLYYASSINEAENILTHTNPDIYLIDIFLQGESGFTFLNEIKNKNGHKIVLTNSVSHEDVTRSYEMGAQLMNKQSTRDSNINQAKFIRDLWLNVRLPDNDFELNGSELNQINEQLQKLDAKCVELNYAIRTLTNNHGHIENDVKNMQDIIFGNGGEPGLKEKYNVVLAQNKDRGLFTEVVTELNKITRRNPLLGIFLYMLIIGVALSVIYIAISS